MPNTSKNLNKARVAKSDEFYTQYKDVENELQYYTKYLCGKKIYCNCDDPQKSNFFKYFVNNFNKLHLKSLTATHFIPQATQTSLNGFDESADVGADNNMPTRIVRKPVKIVIYYVIDNPKKDITNIEYLLRCGNGNYIQELEGDGDFRSEECTAILKQSDIVVTNPPFSLFRDFVSHLLKFDDVDFLIIGSQLAASNNPVARGIFNGSIYIGYNYGNMSFNVPELYISRYNEKTQSISKKYENRINLRNTCWYTTFKPNVQKKRIELTEKYSPEKYPKYDKCEEYGIIRVDKYKEIPYDYTGMMDVPLTFLAVYNPEQFELIGLASCVLPKEVLTGGRLTIGGKRMFPHVLIRHRTPSKYAN